MNHRAALALIVFAACASPARAAEAELVFTNAGLSRTVGIRGSLLTTIKLESGGAKILASPSVEFMIDVSYKGVSTTLIPSDFAITGKSTDKVGPETRTSIDLQSQREGLPIAIRVTYYCLPKASYQQKSIAVRPCSKAPGAVLKGVLLEDLELREEFVPVAPLDRFAGRAKPEAADAKARFVFGASDFAAIDQKTNRGIFFFVASGGGSERMGRDRRLIASEKMEVPLETGYETGRATIGTATGPPEVLYGRFRDFLWENYCAARSRTGTGPDGPRAVAREGVPIAQLVHQVGTAEGVEFADGQQADCLRQRQIRYNYGFVFPPATIFAGRCESEPVELWKRFSQYRGVYQHVLDFPDGKHIDGEAHIIANKGLIVLHNPANEPQKADLPLDEPGLELRGALALTDWTKPNSPADLGKAKPGDKVEIEVAPGGTRVVGVNVGG